MRNAAQKQRLADHANLIIGQASKMLQMKDPAVDVNLKAEAVTMLV